MRIISDKYRIKKIALLTFIVFSTSTSLFPQQGAIDSLNQLLQSKIHDTSKTLVFAKLSREYLYFKTDTALLLAQKGLNLSKQINFAKGEAHALNSMANAISQAGNNVKALELLLEVLKISEKIKDDQLTTMALGNIGIIYYSQGDYEKAIQYYLRSYAIAVNSKNEYSIVANLINIGSTYEKANRLDSAIFYTNKAYEKAIKGTNVEFLSGVLNSLGDIYSKMQQPLVAKAKYQEALSYAYKSNFNEGVCADALGIAKLFLKQGVQDSSLFYAKLSLSTAKKYAFPEWILNSSNFLFEYYKESKLVDSAYYYLTVMVTAKDTLFNQEKNREIQNLSFNEAMRQQELATIKALQDKERSDNIQYALLGIGLITFTVIFTLITHSIIINEKWIKFLGVLGLLLLFEFLNLVLHPYIAKVTHHSPLFMLFLMVILAAILIPQHHRIEKWIVHKMIEKNKTLRVKAKKRIELEPNSTDSENS